MRLPTGFEVIAFIIGAIAIYFAHGIIKWLVYRVKRLFGWDDSPLIEINKATRRITEDYLDLVHLEICNVGFKKARRVKDALNAWVKASICGSWYELDFDNHKPERKHHLVKGQNAYVPFVIRSEKDEDFVPGRIDRFRVRLEGKKCYITDDNLLTQSSPKEIKFPGEYDVVVVVQWDNGDKKSETFKLKIPPVGERIILEKTK